MRPAAAAIQDWPLISIISAYCASVSFCLAGIHREHAAPLEAVPVFRHEMHMQVAARVAIRAVVQLVRVEPA